MHNKKILVLGSNSFSGASFVEFLTSRGNHVLGISRSTLVDPVFHPKLSEARKNGLFRFFRLDLNLNLDEICEVIQREKINIIINYAAQSMVGESWENPLDWIQTNVVSLTSLLKRLEQSDCLEQFIQFSTPEVYGSTENLWLEEGSSFNPSTPYAVSRAAGDMMLRIYFDEKKFPVKFTRAANVYGEGQPLYRIIPRTVFSMFTSNKLELHGGGHSTRSFIHIEDVNFALLKVIEVGQFGSDYHISTQELVSIRDLVEKICEMTSRPFNEKVAFAADRPGKDQAYSLDTKKIRNELGWEDKIVLSDGLYRVIDWIKNNIEELNSHASHYIHKK